MTRDIRADLVGRDRMSPAFKSAGKSSDGLRGKLGKIGPAAAAGAAALGAALGIAAVGLFNTGVKMEAMGNKARTVFGKDFPAAAKAADKLNEKLGMSRTETEGLLAGYGDLLIPMGFTTKASAKMAGQMGDLTGAMVQWSGGTKSAADVQDILAGALTGEYDSLKSLGVQISAETIKEKLLAAGKGHLTGAARKQAEAEIAMAEITKQSASAIESYEGKTNKLGLAKLELIAKVKDARDWLAAKLLPIFVRIATWIVDKGIPAFVRLKDWIGPKLGAAVAFVRDLIEKFREKMTGSGATAKRVRSIIERLKDIFDKLKPVLKFLAEVVFVSVRTQLRLIGRVLENVVIPAIDKALGWFDKLLGKVETVVNKIKAAWSKLPSFNLSLPDVPGFGGGRAMGGRVDPRKFYVVGERGPELFAPDSAGRVIPNGGSASMGGGGGVVVQVSGFVGNERQLAAEIRRILNAANARGVTA